MFKKISPENLSMAQAFERAIERDSEILKAQQRQPGLRAIDVTPPYTPHYVKIVLEGERPSSWNKYWSGMHWSKRSAEKDRVKMLVRSQLDPDMPMFSQPVEIHVRAFFKGKLQDCSNICIKPYEDAIIGWLIEDDSPEHVTAVRVESHKDNKRPRVEIEVVAT